MEAAVSRRATTSCKPGKELRKITEVGDRLDEYSDPLLLIVRSGTIRNDLDGKVVNGSTSEDDLYCKTSVEIVIVGKWDLCQGFKDRALAGRLVSIDNKLGEGEDAFETTFSDLSNCIENATLLIGLKVVKR